MQRVLLQRVVLLRVPLLRVAGRAPVVALPPSSVQRVLLQRVVLLLVPLLRVAGRAPVVALPPSSVQRVLCSSACSSGAHFTYARRTLCARTYPAGSPAVPPRNTYHAARTTHHPAVSARNTHHAAVPVILSQDLHRACLWWSCKSPSCWSA